MTAESYFEWVRDCARDADAVRERLAQGHQPRRSSPLVAAHGTGADPMAWVDAAIDRDNQLSKQLAGLDAIVSGARQVVARVADGLGLLAALALELYYIERNTWDDIALELHVSISTVYRMRRNALAWVDMGGYVVNVGRC